MDNSLSSEQIEARAYEIYLERGRQDGRDVEDWLAAEKELSQQRSDLEALFERLQPHSAKLAHAAAASSRRK